MTPGVRVRAEAAARLLAEDIAQFRGLGPDELEPEWKSFAEAVGLFVYARGEFERIGAVGAMFYTVSRLPEPPEDPEPTEVTL